MKKFSVFLSLLLTVSLLCGCAGTPVIYHEDCTCPTNASSAVQTPATEAAPQPTEAPVTATGALKTGLYIATNVRDSKAATAEAPVAEAPAAEAAAEAPAAEEPKAE